MSVDKSEIHIDPDAPFENDKLDREDTARKLTSLMLSFEDSLVLSINGRWGAGKTTFIKMWNHMLENEDWTSPEKVDGRRLSCRDVL